jgi:hypothetical protein
MYFTPADQWPSDDEIERAYVLIKKDLTEQNGRPREIPVAKSAPVEFRQSEILVWLLPDSILSLSYGLVREEFLQMYVPPSL